MSFEKEVCTLVKQHWSALHDSCQKPDSLVFLKIAGKTSPNGSIIAMILDAHHRRPVAVAKIPRNPQSVLGLEREYEAMVDLRKSINNPNLLPHISYRGVLVENNGVKILLQTAGLGRPMVSQMISRKAVEAIYAKILPWMIDFHIDGAKEYTLSGKVLHDLVQEPILQFVEQFDARYVKILSDESKQYLLSLSHKVEGRKIFLCRQHGDFNSHNIVLDYDNVKINDFTLIDWEDYRDQQLPIHDLNHFFISNSNLLGEGMAPEDSYANLLLNKGWYHDLYERALNSYAANNLVDHNTFLALTPLYFIDMCLRMSDVQRAQQDTESTWIKRLNKFIECNIEKIE